MHQKALIKDKYFINIRIWHKYFYGSYFNSLKLELRLKFFKLLQNEM